MKLVAFGFLFAASMLFAVALATPSKTWFGSQWPKGNVNNLLR